MNISRRSSEVRFLGISSLLATALLVVPGINCGKGSSGAASQTTTNTGTGTGTTPSAYNYVEVVHGLSKPASITISGSNTLMVAQEPTAPQDASVARIDLETGRVNLMGVGSGVRSGIAANHAGRLYWVDAPKGALMTKAGLNDAPAVLHAGGALPPTTIAVDASDRVYVADVAPGSNGAAAVMVRGSSLKAIADVGGPEKTTMVASESGDLYWTSSKAGLIYHRAPNGSGNVVVSGLNAPQGLALDPSEDVLYFTEIPTPGVAGSAGGRNTVSALDLSTQKRTVVHSGDPHPAGVAVAPNGNVYWTSTNRGVVMMAVPTKAAAAASAPFVAALSGSEEVPPVTTQATGQATFSLASDPALNYQISVTGIGRVRRVEICLGDKGKVGSRVATLYKGEDSEEEDDEHRSAGPAAGSFSISGRLRAKRLKGDFEKNWAAFTAALSAGKLYLNVSTEAHRKGEVRGQISDGGSTPTNHTPTAAITEPSGNVTIQAGESVAFSGTASDPDGDAVTVAWEFGDGTSSSSLTPSRHTYPAAGTYTVRLRATDSHGLTDPNPPTRTITVQPATANQAPKGVISAPAGNVTITAGQSVSFAGTASDPNGDAVTVLWEFGDGATSMLLAPGNHTYATAGTYTVRLTTKDALGLADPNPPTRTITVQPAAVNQPPTASITAPTSNVTITAGQSVSFSGTASDPNGDAVTVLWSFGDGSTSTSLSPGNHTFATVGTYTIRLTATDAKGLADPNPPTRTITVNDAGTGAPTLTQLQTQIFTSLCTGCHDAGGSAGMNLTAGNAYANLVNVPATTLPGMRVVPGNPGASAIVAQLAGGHRNVSAANQSLISAWIAAGALNN